MHKLSNGRYSRSDSDLASLAIVLEVLLLFFPLHDYRV